MSRFRKVGVALPPRAKPSPEHPRPEDLQEFSKHVRGIYYLIILSASAILLATSAGPDRTIEQAIDQLGALIRVTDEWNEQWLDELAQQTVDEVAENLPGWVGTLPDHIRIEIDKSAPIGTTTSPADRTLLAELPAEILANYQGRTWTLYGPGGYSPPGENSEILPDLLASAVFLRSFDTVREARSLWDSLVVDPRANFLLLPPSLIGLIQQGRDSESKLLSVKISLSQSDSRDDYLPYFGLVDATDSVKSHLGPLFAAPRVSRGSANGFEVGTNEITHVWRVRVDEAGGRIENEYSSEQMQKAIEIEIPLHVYRVPVAAQKFLIDQMATPLSLGEFDFTFSELAEYTQGLEELPLRDLRTYLSGQAEQISDDVEVFGLSFRGKTLGTWGLIFLAAVQLYFAASFRQFALLRSQAAWRFPWIALYRDWLSRSMFAISAFFYPAAVVLVLGYEQIMEDAYSWGGVMSVMGILFSVCSSGWGMKIYAQLKRGGQPGF